MPVQRHPGADGAFARWQARAVGAGIGVEQYAGPSIACSSAIQAVLGCEAVKSIYDSDERLRRFWGTFVNPEIPIHTLQAARLL